MDFAVVVSSRAKDWPQAAVIGALEEQSVGSLRIECFVVTEVPLRESSTTIRVHEVRATTMEHTAAREAAWRSSRAETLVFLDADYVPDRNWLLAFKQALDGQAADVSWGHTSTRMHDGSRRRCPAGHPCASDVPNGRRAVCVGVQTLRLLDLELSHLPADEVGNRLRSLALLTGSWAVRREVLERTQGFVPALSSLADWELGIQLVELRARFGRAERGRITRVEAAECWLSGAADEFVGLFHRHPYEWVASAANWLFTDPISLTAITDHVRRAGEPWWTQSAPLPAYQWMPFSEMVDYLLERGGLPQDTRPEIEGYLRHGMSRGLYTQTVEGEILLERYLTTRWLDTRTTWWERSLLRSCAYMNKTPVQELGADGQPLALRVKGTYRVSVSDDAIRAAGVGATLSLPLPVECSEQTEVRLHGCIPADLDRYFDLDRTVCRVPLEAGGLISYDFECVVRERTNPAPPAIDEPLPEHLRVALAPRHRERVDAIVRSALGETTGRDPEAVARAVYKWILNSTSFHEAPRGANFIIETGLGSCFHRVRLFTQACRIAGVAVRERCAALLGGIASLPSEILGTEAITRGHSSFVHTWAEFFCPIRGWMSVEFIGADWGRRALTAHNISDSDLRRRIEAESDLYESYFFGRVDPYRVYASPRANRIATYPVGRQSDAANVQAVMLGTKHALSCKVIRVEFSPH